NSLQTNPDEDRIEANLAARLARLRQCKGSVCRRGVQLSLGAQLQRRGSCRASRLLVRVGGPSRRRISNVAVYIDGHLLKRDRRGPFTVVVPKRFTRPSGSLLEALTTLTDSRRQTVSRHINGCAF